MPTDHSCFRFEQSFGIKAFKSYHTKCYTQNNRKQWIHCLVPRHRLIYDHFYTCFSPTMHFSTVVSSSYFCFSHCDSCAQAQPQQNQDMLLLHHRLEPVTMANVSSSLLFHIQIIFIYVTFTLFTVEKSQITRMSRGLKMSYSCINIL